MLEELEEAFSGVAQWVVPAMAHVLSPQLSGLYEWGVSGDRSVTVRLPHWRSCRERTSTSCRCLCSRGDPVLHMPSFSLDLSEMGRTALPGP